MTTTIKAADAAWKAAWDVMVQNPTDKTRAAYLEAHRTREAAYESAAPIQLEPAPLVTLVCVECGQPFETYFPTSKCCSFKCAETYYPLGGDPARKQ